MQFRIPPSDPTNDLLTLAHRLSSCSTEVETLRLALLEFIHRRRKAQREVQELFSTIEYYVDYDYKKHR